MSSDYEEEALELQNIEEGGLSQVASLVRQQLALERRVADLEDDLAKAQRELKVVSEDLLPATLAEFGMTKLRMEDGSEISVSRYYGASISKAKQGEAFTWLLENGHDDLIKNQVSVSFGRSDDSIAQSLRDRLEEEGFETNQKVWVEPMTLKAFVKEQVESGAPIPTETFGIFIGERAKITRRK